METLAKVLDFALRLAFFALVPPLLVLAAEVFPVTGALVQMALSIVVLFAGEAARALTQRSRVARLVLSGQLEFEAFYGKNPPRPFLYYVFYPLLFPYWLSVKAARQEFLLYKGYTLASFGLLVASLAVQYVLAFPPELGVSAFLPIAGYTLLAEAVVVLMFLMPMATSVVHFHQARAPKRLAVLLLAALVTTSFALMRIHLRRDPIVSFATRRRVQLRTEASEKNATRAEEAALRAAWKALPTEKDDVDKDGKVNEAPLDAAHQALGTFYRSDEAQAFDVWRTKRGKQTVLVLYFASFRKRDPVWLAYEPAQGSLGKGGTKERFTRDAKELPKGAFDAMWNATQ